MTSLSNIHYLTKCAICTKNINRDLLGELTKEGVVCGWSNCAISLCAGCYLDEIDSTNSEKCPICKMGDLYVYSVSLKKLGSIFKDYRDLICKKWEPIAISLNK